MLAALGSPPSLSRGIFYDTRHKNKVVFGSVIVFTLRFPSWNSEQKVGKRKLRVCEVLFRQEAMFLSSGRRGHG